MTENYPLRSLVFILPSIPAVLPRSIWSVVIGMRQLQGTIIMLVINIMTNDKGRSFTASCEDICYTHARKSPVSPLCRRLIDRGHSADTMVMVCRRNVSGLQAPVFKPRSLGAWAAFDIVDDDNRGLLRRRYRPLPGFSGGPAPLKETDAQSNHHREAA